MAWVLRRVIMSPRHGERGNVISEIAYFRPAWWCGEFRANGYKVLDVRPMGLFYTGNMVLGAGLGLDTRRWLSAILGSASYIYRVCPAQGEDGRRT